MDRTYLLSFHKCDLFPLGARHGGILRRFPATAHVQIASPQIPSRQDAALPNKKISFMKRMARFFSWKI